MTDQELNPQAVAPDTASIDSDLMCLSCDYNLRGLSRTGRCPECGHEIEKTIVARQGMTKRELAALAFRITALWMALESITGLVGTMGYVFTDLFQLMIAILWAGASVLLTAAVWWKAGLLARLAIINDGPILLEGPFIPELVISIALSIIGILHIIYAITSGAWAAMSMITNWSKGYALSATVTATLNLVIGCVLLIGAGRIARFVIWLRTAGTIKKTE